MNSIEPFNYEELIDFNASYLSGFLAEKYDVEKDAATLSSLERAKQSAFDEVMRDINYSSFISETKEYNVIEENTIYALLPVYMVNIKYQNKFYTFAMNGETGKMIGDIPYSKKKALIYYLVIYAICFVILAVLTYFM